MGITVSCAVCGRQFTNIDPSMIGQKARCSCGAVVLLVAPDAPVPSIQAPTPPVKPPLSPVPQPPPIQTTNPANELQTAKPRREKRRSAKRTKKKSKPLVVAPIVVQTPSQTEPAQPLPVAPITVKPVNSQSPVTPQPVRELGASENAERPIVGDSFADMDDVLSGGIDTSPIRAKESTPQIEPAPTLPSSASTSYAQASPVRTQPAESKPEDSVVGVIATAVAGVSSLVMGVVLLLPRLAAMEGSALAWLGVPLNSLYEGVYGSAPIDGFFRTPLWALGWLLTLIAPVAIVIGIVLIIRGILQGTGMTAARWSTRMGAILGVVVLFGLMATLFMIYAHHDQMADDLLELVPQVANVEGEVELPENVRVAVEENDQVKSRFSFAMMILALFPLTLFLGSIVSMLSEEKTA